MSLQFPSTLISNCACVFRMRQLGGTELSLDIANRGKADAFAMQLTNAGTQLPIYLLSIYLSVHEIRGIVRVVVSVREYVCAYA